MAHACPAPVDDIREDHVVFLLQPEDFARELHARPIFRQREFASGGTLTLDRERRPGSRVTIVRQPRTSATAQTEDSNDVARACSSKFPNELIDLSNDVIALRLKPSATQWAAESPTNPLGFDITQK